MFLKWRCIYLNLIENFFWKRWLKLFNEGKTFYGDETFFKIVDETFFSGGWKFINEDENF
jgi:hypothetical protein